MPERSPSVSRQISERNERIAVGLAFGERRVGEQRGRDRLQRERDAHLLDHVGFGGEVEIGLHRAGPVHHVEAELADLRHVGGHDAVAALRHHRDLGAAPGRRHAEAEEADAERLGDLAQLREMRHQLAAGAVDARDRRTGEFELAAGLERDRPAAGHVGEADDVLALHDRLPAEQGLHAFEQRADTARAAVGHRLVAGEREGEFLVLGADPEPLGRLLAFREPRDELVARLDRRHIDLVTGHERSTIPGGGARPYTCTAKEQLAGRVASGMSAISHQLVCTQA